MTCINCGQGIRRAGVLWIHTHTNTSTGTPHITCGYDGERGTSAEPETRPVGAAADNPGLVLRRGDGR